MISQGRPILRASCLKCLKEEKMLIMLIKSSSGGLFEGGHKEAKSCSKNGIFNNDHTCWLVIIEKRFNVIK